MNKNPFLKLLMVGILVLVGSNTISAQAEKVELVIHKRMYVDPNANPEFKVNSGLLEIDQPDTYGFDGVEFTLIDLTEYFENQNNAYEETMEYLLNMDRSLLDTLISTDGEVVQKTTTSTVNGESGIGQFIINTSEYNKENQVFLILETYTPYYLGEYEVIYQGAPLFVVLPVENPEQTGTYLSTIHLYPKNFGYTIIPEPPVQEPEIPDLPATGIEEKLPVLGIELIASGLVIIALSTKFKKETFNEEK